MKICPTFHIFRPIWINVCTKDIHRHLLSNYKDCENWYSVSYTWFMGINEFISIHSTFILRLW